MKTHFTIFCDSAILQGELLQAVGLCGYEDIPANFVRSFSQMYLGESAPFFSKILMFQNLKTDNFHGIMFSHTVRDGNKSVLHISVASLDKRLQSKAFLGHIFQALINDFCNSNPYQDTFIKWDNECYPCRYSGSITFPAERLATLLCQ